MVHRWQTAVVGLGLLVGTGCGEDEAAVISKARKYFGIYEVTSYTENEESCDAEGPSALEDLDETHLAVTHAAFFGIEFVQAMTCPDEATCRDAVEKLHDQEIVSADLRFTFTEEEGGIPVGKTVIAFSGIDDTCSAEVTTFRMTGTPGTDLRIEARTSHGAEEFPVDDDGFCNTTDAERAARGQPCTEYDVVEASFVSEI